MSAAGPLAYLISPQTWSGFKVSKHHYAVALAGRGWRVVFINPPAKLGRIGAIKVDNTEIDNVVSVNYQPFFPYSLKFRSRGLFDKLMCLQALVIRQKMGKPDLVWDFDNAYQFRDLRAFGAATTIFHLVDDVGRHGLGDKHADHFLALHPRFLENAGGPVRDNYVIGHGLGAMHVAAKPEHYVSATNSASPHIGLVANLGAEWLDWAAVAEMVSRHPEARFTFWGPLPKVSCTPAILQTVISAKNATFPGLTSPEDIIAQSVDVDIWLLPFLSEKFEGGCPVDSHKVLEYLSTGKVVLMSWLEAYQGNSLVSMSDSPESRDLPERLDQLLCDLTVVNASEVCEARRSYALARSYERRLDQIWKMTGLASTSTMYELMSSAA